MMKNENGIIAHSKKKNFEIMAKSLKLSKLFCDEYKNHPYKNTSIQSNKACGENQICAKKREICWKDSNIPK